MSFTKKLIHLVKGHASAIGKRCAKWIDQLGKWPFSTKSLRAPLGKMGFPMHPMFPSLIYINICQITGAFNNNLLKFLLIYFLIDQEGIQNTPQILASIGAIYVIPFILFSSLGGKIADCTSKKNIAVVIKLTEILILLFGCFSFWIKSPLAGYGALFLLALNSALYGPAKYGILKDLFSSQKIAVASSSVTSFTYTGIILGMFFASFLTALTHRNFTLSLGVGVVISCFGLVAACLIPPTSPRAGSEEVGLQKSYRLWKQAAKIPYLRISLLLGSFFLLIGSFVQLNIIPFAIQEMGLSDVYGGYLFLGCAVGIALGSLVAGQLLKRKGEIAISSIAAILLGLSILVLAFSGNRSFWFVFAELGVIGFFGGCFVVPCETHLQLYSPDSERGSYIALLNGMSFLGALVAAALISLFGKLGLTAKESFILLTIMILGIVLSLLKKQLWSFFRLDEFYIQQKIKHRRDPSTWPISIDPLPSEVASLVAWRKRVAQRGSKSPLMLGEDEARQELKEEVMEELEEISEENALLWVLIPQVPSCEELTTRRILTAISSLFEGNPPLLFLRNPLTGNPKHGFLGLFCEASKRAFVRRWNQEHLAIAVSEPNDQREERVLDDFLSPASPFAQEEPGEEKNCQLKFLSGFREKLATSAPFYYLQWEIEMPLETEETALKYPKKRWKGHWVKVHSSP